MAIVAAVNPSDDGSDSLLYSYSYIRVPQVVSRFSNFLTSLLDSGGQISTCKAFPHCGNPHDRPPVLCN
jgi:hypothetical protein